MKEDGRQRSVLREYAQRHFFFGVQPYCFFFFNLRVFIKE